MLTFIFTLVVLMLGILIGVQIGIRATKQAAIKIIEEETERLHSNQKGV